MVISAMPSDPSRPSRVETLDENVVEAARRGQPKAIHEVLATVYPTVMRMAMGLSGREDVARGIVAFVMRQGARRFDKWTDPGAPWRWFAHHTVLTARRSARHAPSAALETLTRGEGETAEFVAFVRALRLLPEQQREAVLLFRCEQLSERALAIAMDCSTSAAAGHLRAAEAALSAMAGSETDDLLRRTREAYVRLTPADQEIGPAVRQWVDRALRPRRIGRWLRLMWWVGLAIAAAWAAYQMRYQLSSWLG